MSLLRDVPLVMPTPPEAVPSPTSTDDVAYPLTIDDYKKVRSNLYTLVDTQNPLVALTELEKLSNQYPSILRSCHAFVHDIGHRAFEKYQDVGKAFIYQDELCGAGYLHGIIEAYFRDTPNVLSHLPSLCQSYGLNAVAQRCYHAIGHGLMFYTQNDLIFAREQCTIFTGIARTRCLEGVYMENFNTDQKTHPSSYLNASNPFYPCAQQPTSNQAICYFYAPIYYLSIHGDTYAQAYEWCTTAPRAYIGACTTGLTTRIMKQHINNPLFVERLCRQARSDQLASCIDGMVSYHFVNFDSAKKTQEMCQLLQPAHQPFCNQSLERRIR